MADALRDINFSLKVGYDDAFAARSYAQMESEAAKAARNLEGAFKIRPRFDVPDFPELRAAAPEPTDRPQAERPDRPQAQQPRQPNPPQSGPQAAEPKALKAQPVDRERDMGLQERIKAAAETVKLQDRAAASAEAASRRMMSAAEAAAKGQVGATKRASEAAERDHAKAAGFAEQAARRAEVAGTEASRKTAAEAKRSAEDARAAAQLSAEAVGQAQTVASRKATDEVGKLQVKAAAEAERASDKATAAAQAASRGQIEAADRAAKAAGQAHQKAAQVAEEAAKRAQQVGTEEARKFADASRLQAERAAAAVKAAHKSVGDAHAVALDKDLARIDAARQKEESAAKKAADAKIREQERADRALQVAAAKQERQIEALGRAAETQAAKAAVAQGKMRESFDRGSEGALKFGRGIAALGLAGEEDTKKILQGLLKIQGAFDVIKGVRDMWRGVSEWAAAAAAKMTAAAAAQKAMQAAQAMKAGPSITIGGGKASGGLGSFIDPKAIQAVNALGPQAAQAGGMLGKLGGSAGGVVPRLAALAGPIGLTVAAVVGLATGAFALGGGFKKLGPATEKFGQVWDNFKAGIGQLGEKLFGGFADRIASVAEKLGDLVIAAQKKIAEIFGIKLPDPSKLSEEQVKKKNEEREKEFGKESRRIGIQAAADFGTEDKADDAAAMEKARLATAQYKDALDSLNNARDSKAIAAAEEGLRAAADRRIAAEKESGQRRIAAEKEITSKMQEGLRIQEKIVSEAQKAADVARRAADEMRGKLESDQEKFSRLDPAAQARLRNVKTKLSAGQDLDEGELDLAEKFDAFGEQARKQRVQKGKREDVFGVFAEEENKAKQAEQTAAAAEQTVKVEEEKRLKIENEVKVKVEYDESFAEKIQEALREAAKEIIDTEKRLADAEKSKMQQDRRSYRNAQQSGYR